MIRRLALLFALISPLATFGQVINCPTGFSTSTSAPCGISVNGGGADFFIYGHPSNPLNGTAAVLTPPNSNHGGWSLIRQTKVNNQAFTATFTFRMNGLNLCFMVEDQTNQSGATMEGGAGDEAGIGQFAGGTNIAVNNMFAIKFDSYQPVTDSGSFTYSTVQMFQSYQIPVRPVPNQPGYLPVYPTNAISTAPVPFNSPATTRETTTGDVYSATVTYNHGTGNLTLNLFDVTAGGSCPGASCFTHTWTGVWIPEIDGSTTAWAGFAAGTSGGGVTSPYENDILSFTYTVDTPSGTPTYTAWNANSTYNNGTQSAASPVYSLAPGTYSGPQTVSITTSTSPNNYICYVLSATTPTLYPQPDNNGGCNAGTLYTGPISITSSSTLYAMAGSSNKAFPTGSVSPAGLGPPSTLVAGSYTIGSGTAAAIPAFSPATGTYTSPQMVTISDATPGATIYYTTNGTTPTTSSTQYTGPVSVGTSETMEAIAVASGDTNSAVGSATYTISPVVSAPTFSLAAGTYTSPQSVMISDATSGSTIYYTVDGTRPTTASTPYTGPISVIATETVQAIAAAPGDTTSTVASAAYTITQPVAAMPVFSPGGGTYTSAQSVTVSDATPGATIYYTTNGSTPTTSSIPYTGPFTVSSTETLRAIAVVTGYTNSAVAAAAFTISVTVAAIPTISPGTGTYTSAQSVAISDATPGATIYYTTNGSTPTTSSAVYTGPISVSSTETVQAFAAASGYTNSAVTSATFTFTPVVTTPTFSPGTGTYSSAQTVAISDATPGATIYYTTNGSTPTTSSSIYTGPITVSSTETLLAIGALTGDVNSAVGNATYTFAPVVATPTFSPAAGTYTSAQTVSISDATSGATIYYTTNGTTPTTSSTAYTGPITVSSTETLQAIAAAAGDTNSAVASAAYTITPVVATPAFSPAAGTYTSAQTVSISDATSGATIYYTTNGTTPTTSSTAYTGPITISSTETLQAIAVATGATNSTVASATYTISASPVVATPAFSPAAGTYGSAQSVTISDTTAGATIYYTTNGTAPTTASTAYSGPITVSATETLEAIAVATGDTNSAVASAAYTIGSAPLATNFAIGTTVQQAGIKRLGINIGGQSYYDSGQLSRNLTVRNPGFEAEMWSSILNCQAATATTCTDSGANAVWPANFLQGATFQFLYGAAKGQTGTVTASSVAGASTGVTLTFSAPLSPAPAAGDVVKVQMQVPGNPQAGWWVTPSGGATFSADTTDLSPETPGKQALAVNAAAGGQSAQVTSYFDSYTGRSFVQLNGTYTLTFRAKAVSGSNQINVSFGRPATSTHGNVSYLNQNVALTNQWQDYSYTFNAAEDGTYVGTAALTFSIAGAQIYLDDVALTEPAVATNPTAFRNAVVDTLRTLQPGVLRFMDGGADFASTTDNMLAVPFARQRAGYGEGQTEQDDISLGLHNFLVLCQAIGAEPWYTVPAGISPADMQNLIQYLAGDASTTYGSIRASLGQSAAWTSVFPTIHLELGNEMWNAGTFAGEAVPNPVAYGSIAGTAFAAARASSSYDPSKFDLVMGSWAVQPSWTSQELTSGSGYDSVDAAPYLFNSLNDYGSNEAIFGPMFAQPEQVDSSPTASGNYMYQQAQAVGAAPAPTKLAVYEVNLSTTSGTAPQTTVNQAAAGLGAGIAVADHMLLMMRDLGITTQNMFALPEYVNAFTGSETVPLWGSVIDMGGETNLLRPQFLAEQLANKAILPTMLASTISGANPTWNQPLSSNDSIQLNNAHYLQSFAFTDGSHFNVVVFNLSRSGSLPVTFSGSNAPTGNVVISQLTSTNPTDNNEGLFTKNPVVAGPTQTNVSNFNPATPYSLPPYSMTVFSWPGALLPASYTALQASPVSTTAGQTVTLTATVSSESGTTTPTGTVTFRNGTATLGTATLNASGVATLSTTTLPVGTDSITAAYGGDSNDAGSTSQAVTVTITAGTVATTTVLTASASAVNAGQSVTFTATVSPQTGSNVPTGTVTFLDGATTLGTAQLNASGVAIFSTSSLTAGTHSITASYGGDGKDVGSISAAVSVVVAQGTVASTTTLSASATQIAAGQSVTFTATVSPQTGTNVPTGTVTFKDGSTTLGTARLNASGVATFSTTGLVAGTQLITASYGGDGKDFGSISPTVSVVVTAGTIATTTTLSASATQITSGQSVTFTATVTPQTGSTVATGTVTFLDGTTSLGTAQLNAGGVATFSTTSLPSGTQSITASYGGDSKNAGSVSGAFTVVVTGGTGSSTTALVASATQITSGQSVTFTATVTSASGSNVPTGTITFKDGSTSLGTAKLNGSGAATFSTTGLSTGTHLITASYGGDGKDLGSISPTVTVVVVQSLVTAATTTTLSASATQLTPGQSVTFTATVAPQAGSSAATGTVTYLDGTVTLGTATLDGSGVATFSTTTLAAGTHSIVASYAGDSRNGSSVSSAVSVTVSTTQPGVVPTTTTLTASSNQLLPANSVTFTAVVVPQSGSNEPTGSITFLDGTTSLGTAQVSAGGGATLSLPSLPLGSHSVIASYSGDANDAPSISAPVVISVTAPEYAMVVSATSLNLTQGAPSTLAVTLIPENGFNMPITLSCSGLPQGTTCTFSPATVTPNGAPVTSTVTMMTAAQSARAPEQAPSGHFGGGFAFGWVMPWGFIPLLGFAKARRRSRLARWSIRVVAAALLIAGSLWVSGCGYSSNGSQYLVTLTASASNAQTHTSQVTVHIQ